MKELPKRKPNRLQGYDYSQNGAYFITVCTKGRSELFGEIPVGAASCRPQFGEIPVGAASCRPRLTDLGEIVETEISSLSKTYANVTVDCHIVMPNHVHMIIIANNDNGRQNAAPTVSRMMNQWKR